MASNDIISTNVPSKVPTTDTEEYPVQHGSAAKTPIVSSDNQASPEESGSIDVEHKANADDEASGSHEGHHENFSKDSTKTGTPQDTLHKEPVDGSPVPNYAQQSWYYHTQPPPQFYPSPYANYGPGPYTPPWANMNMPIPGANTNPDKTGGHYQTTGPSGDSSQYNPAYYFPYQLEPKPGLQSQTTTECTFGQLHNPRKTFTLSKVNSPHYYDSWVREMCQAMLEQNLGHLIPTEDNKTPETPEPAEKRYIEEIHIACVPEEKYPKWLKSSYDEGEALIDCFKEGIRRIKAEEDPEAIVLALAGLTLDYRESIPNFAKRLRKIHQRTVNAKFPMAEKIVISRALKALPERYEKVDINFTKSNDQSFNNFINILLTTEPRMKSSNQYDNQRFYTNSERKQVDRRPNRKTVHHIGSKTVEGDLRPDTEVQEE